MASAPLALRAALGALLSVAALPAQVQLGTDEAQVRWVDGRPMLLATLRAEDRVYLCHLLLDLGATEPLFLHRNAASVLKSRECQVELGTIKLSEVPFSAKRDTWLEGLTKEFAEALQQVPVAGILGLSALAGHDVVLDGPAGVLRLRRATAGGDAPPTAPNLTALPLVTEPGRTGVGFAVDLGGSVAATLVLYTRDPFCWIEPALAAQVGHADGVLATARAGELDFARLSPFRPVRAGNGQGGIGGALLSALVLTLQPAANRLLLEQPTPPRYPEDEAAFYRARYGSTEPAPLRAFLTDYAGSAFAAEAARTLIERLGSAGTKDLAALQDAGLAAIRTAPAKGKATAALEVLEHLPQGAEAVALRRAIAAAGLADARADEDGSTGHKLHLELGQLARLEHDAVGARRHLLAAVFGMPVSGPANLALGALHEEQGQLEQALGRYFLALLDARTTGQEGYVAFVRTHQALHGAKADVVATLADLADGRVPAFHPLPRDPATVRKTGRTVLAELFTGAMCPPCVAADVAADGLGELFGADELVVVQWHLPIPAPEPLVSPASLWRGQARGVRSTPTLIVAGGEPLSGGGKAEDAPEQFRRYRELVETELGQAPTAQLQGAAALAGDQLTVTVHGGAREGATRAEWRLHAVLVEEQLVFPGSNGILFHHQVARARLTPEDGVPLAGTSAQAPWRGGVALTSVTRDLEEVVSELERRQAFRVRPVALDARQLQVVCFVESSPGGKVLQALRVPVTNEGKR